MVTTGVVGSGLPIANGLALSSQNRGDGKVTVTCFGDGATNIGAFHEAMNMAQLWKLPVIFFCQNNRYGEHTAFADHTKVDSISSRAAAYAMRTVTVDGNDAEAMYLAAKEAVDKRAGRRRADADRGDVLPDDGAFLRRGFLIHAQGASGRDGGRRSAAAVARLDAGLSIFRKRTRRDSCGLSTPKWTRRGNSRRTAPIRGRKKCASMCSKRR